MRTSLNEIKQIEDHLFQKLEGGEEVLFNANMILNRNLTENVRLQQESYLVIRAFGRKQFRRELEALHQKIFTQPEHLSFRQKVTALFSLK